MNYFLPFDPIGYFPSFYTQSKIISYKNLLLYNLHKEINLSMSQIQLYVVGKNYGFDHNIIEKYYNLFINYLKNNYMLIIEELPNYSAEIIVGVNKQIVTIRDLQSSLLNFAVARGWTKEFFNQGLKNIMIAYKGLMENYGEDNYDEIYMNCFNSLYEITSSLSDQERINIHGFFAEFQQWFDVLKLFMEKIWKDEFIGVLM